MQFKNPQLRRNVVLALILVGLVNVLPPVISTALNIENLLVHVIYGSIVLGWVAVCYFWLARRASTWANTVILLGTWLLALGFTAVFSREFSNAYLSFVLAVLITFAVQGPRYGTAMLALTGTTLLFEIYRSGGAHVESDVFALTLLATVGIATWVFVSAAIASGAEAQRLAAEVTKLNRLILTSQDSERRRLARDIHDGPLQSMGVELLAIERAKRRIEAGQYEKASSELEQLREIARETVSDLRSTVNMLRNTLLDSGLLPAFQNLARKTADNTGLTISVSLSIEQDLTEEAQTCLYQLAVEALNNVKKHALARNVNISVTGDQQEITLTVEDDGKGFDYEDCLQRAINAGHIGLHTMKERAAEFGGKMEVLSLPGSGTKLAFTFPAPSCLASHVQDDHSPEGKAKLLEALAIG